MNPRAPRAGGRRAGVRHRFRLVFPLLATCLAACAPPAGDTAAIDLTWTLAPPVPRAGELRLLLELAETGAPVTDAALEVHGLMTHPGMVPLVTRATEIAPGRYEARLELTMPGDWVLLVDGALADGRRIRRDLALPGVMSP